MWYVEASELEVKVMGNEGVRKIDVKNGDEWKRIVEKKKELGERLLAQYGEDFEKSRGNSGDMKMLVATQRSGTAIDKVSAYSVMVGENAIANVKSLDALLGMVTSKVGKRHALTGFEALKELFVSSLLPDRKLKTLIQQPVNHLPETKDGYSLLLFWYWEECLKQRYERFVFALEEASRDMLPILKDKALKTMYVLLTSKSEQERRLLSALVNKLGDPENKGASNADFYLTNLLSAHPNMKAVVIDEVDSFLFRPHMSLRAKYHAVNFLSQVRLGHKGDGPKVAKHLVDVYFALFKMLIEEGDNNKPEKSKEDEKNKKFVKSSKEQGPVEPNVEMDSRLLSALLTGVNRAFPFVASDEADDVVEVQTPMLFKLVHSKNFNVGVQALLLLDKLSSKNKVVSDRFYRALYSKLLAPAAMNSSKAEMFIGLLLKAMKSDINLKRISAFSKRLMQVALQQPPQFACGCLFLLSELLKARPPLWNMVLQNESIDDEFEHFEDIIEDSEVKVETGPPKQPEIIDEIANDNNNVIETDGDESSDLEVKEDFAASDSDASDGEIELFRGKHSIRVAESKPVSNSDKGQPQSSLVWSSLPGGYDPRHRDPSFCRAERASWWELMVLASHVHPSVSTMARTLLSGANIVYNGNPLNDLSLTAFLDKFMEKKPKQATWHGGSQIEPSKKLDTSEHLIGADILSLAEVDVPAEDLVFHKFYLNKMNSSKKPKKKKKKKKGIEDEAAEEIIGVDGINDSDEEIGGDESDIEEIDNLLDSGDIPAEADGDYDYDDLDQVADEDDDDLIGGSDTDAEADAHPDLAEGEEVDSDGFDQMDIMDDDNVDIDSENEESFSKTKGKRKTGASPFASVEEYEHLLKEEDDVPKKEKSKSRKKRKSSD